MIYLCKRMRNRHDRYVYTSQSNPHPNWSKLKGIDPNINAIWASLRMREIEGSVKVACACRA